MKRRHRSMRMSQTVLQATVVPIAMMGLLAAQSWKTTTVLHWNIQILRECLRITQLTHQPTENENLFQKLHERAHPSLDRGADMQISTRLLHKSLARGTGWRDGPKMNSVPSRRSCTRGLERLLMPLSRWMLVKAPLPQLLLRQFPSRTWKPSITNGAVSIKKRVPPCLVYFQRWAVTFV